MADIPGIIEGASEGAGLGLRFLRHVERNRVLLHVITVDPDPDRDPISDFDKLMQELAHFDESLVGRPMLVALSKTDLPEVKEAEADIKATIQQRGTKSSPSAPPTATAYKNSPWHWKKSSQSTQNQNRQHQTPDPPPKTAPTIIERNHTIPQLPSEFYLVVQAGIIDLLL